MSSEAEKTKKKGAKKKAAKAADVVDSPQGEQLLEEARESVDREIAEGYDGVPVLLGAATVSLHMEFEDATSPVDAVNQALTELTLNGLRSFTFLVRDEVTNQMYAVRGGQMIALDQEE